MSSHHIGKMLAGFVLLIAMLGAGSARAQSVCVGPFLGAGGVEELCVNIRETETGASMDFRGSSPLLIQEMVGDYTVDLMVLFASDGDGMGVVLDGMVTRTSAGTGALVVTADGGLGTPLAASTGGSCAGSAVSATAHSGSSSTASTAAPTTARPDFALAVNAPV